MKAEQEESPTSDVVADDDAWEPEVAATASAPSKPPAPTLLGLGSVEAATQAARMQGALLPGSTFGVYIVGECIGEGGMARIYRAEHAGLRRQVALKVLTNGFAKDPEGRERFVREARIAAAIKHPNVVNIFDVGVYEGIPYMAMELLEGTDLESMVREQGALDEATILDVMVPVVAGLTAVHDAGIVHRDLKPGNIFLSRGRYDELEAKLLDFGISKANGPDQLKLTTHGLLMGTPFYMSPEGFRGEEMTPLSDQYSLGVVMYECATGRGPFIALTLPELVRVITSGEYKPPNEYNPNVSKRLARIITRAMSLDPADRYEDLREMGRELLQLAGQRTRITWGLSFGEISAAAAAAPRPKSLAPLAASVPPPSGESVGSRKSTRVVVAAALLLLLLLGIHAGRPAEERPPTPSAAAALQPVQPVASPAAVVGATSEMKVAPAASPPGAPEVVPLAQASAPRAAAQPKQRAAGARERRRSAGNDQPEWALPANAVPMTPSRTADSRLSPGTNGAPILD